MNSALDTFTNAFHNNKDALKLVALGAILGVVLPESKNLLSWLRLHFVYRSRLSRYQHAFKSAVSAANATPQRSTSDRAWALVTGASDGIGYGFVCELASRGFNIILHGRNATKIAGLITTLEQNYPQVKFEAFVLSATVRDEWSGSLSEFVQSLRNRNINLTVLVNNVGGSFDTTRSFEPLAVRDSAQITGHIDMNITFATQITAALLPILVENKPGLIINMGSFAGTLTLPWLSIYCGAKAYNLHFSRCLRLEMMAEGHPEVEVLGVVCGKVATAGTGNPTPELFMPSAKHYAGYVLNKVGCGQPIICGYWGHSLQTFMIGLLPAFMAEQVSIKISGSAKREEEGRRIPAQKG